MYLVHVWRVVFVLVYSAASNGGFIFRSNRLLWPSYLLLALCHTQIGRLSLDRLNPANLGQPHENQTRHQYIETETDGSEMFCPALFFQMKAFNSFNETNTVLPTLENLLRAWIFKHVRSPEIDFKESILSVYVAWQDNPFRRTDPSGFIGWRRNRSLGSLNR
jgi:hypothetical protein